MKILGQILMWLGFISGALATVFHLPKAGVEKAIQESRKPSEELGFEPPDLSSVEVVADGWHLIPWTWYCISAAVCVVGVVMIRMALSSTRNAAEEETSADLKLLKGYLSNLVRDTEKLKTELPKLAPTRITGYIDSVLSGDFRAFANDRESLIPMFGLTVYADIMTDFAAGERAINRAWSAAADGYVEEAMTCVEREIVFLREAFAALEKAEKSGMES